MSVIVKKVFPPKGQAPGDVSIISKIAYNTKAYIKWSDPANTVSNGVTVATWAGTILLRKTGSYPTSPTDGTVVVNNTTRDKYKSSDFTDTGLTNGTTYYYRFFTYDNGILKSYNTNTSMQFTLTCYNASTTLANNSWATIAAISESGNASSLWNIGDEIEITLTSVLHGDTRKCVLQIWDFNHYDKVDGSGKAGITFGCKWAVLYGGFNSSNVYMYANDTTTGGWNGTKMKQYMDTYLFNAFPSEVQSIIKEVVTSANMGWGGGWNTDPTKSLTCNDKISLPSFNEVFNKDEQSVYGSSLNNFDGGQGNKVFPIFTDDESRQRRRQDSAVLIDWYTRSPRSESYSYSWCIVNSNGKKSITTVDPSSVRNIIFCFNV